MAKMVASDTVANLHTVRGADTAALRGRVRGAAANQVRQQLEQVSGVAKLFAGMPRWASCFEVDSLRRKRRPDVARACAIRLESERNEVCG